MLTLGYSQIVVLGTMLFTVIRQTTNSNAVSKVDINMVKTLFG